MTKVIPVGNMIKVKCLKAEVKLKKDEELVKDEKTGKYEVKIKSSLLFIPAKEKYDDEELTEAACKGIVMDMGKDCYTDEFQFKSTRCAVGDVVYFRRYSGIGFKEEGEDYLLLQDGQIVGKEVEV